MKYKVNDELKPGDVCKINLEGYENIKVTLGKELERYGLEMFKCIDDKDRMLIINADKLEKIGEEIKCEDCIYYQGKYCCSLDVVCFRKEKFVKRENKQKEEKKYLKTWEAIKALEEGFKVRVIGCEGYLKIDKDDILVNELGYRVNFQIDGLSTKLNWEIYEEPKKEMPKEFEGLKYILGSINNMDCEDKDCDKCPLGMEKCDMLDEIFFDMKEKYNF